MYTNVEQNILVESLGVPSCDYKVYFLEGQFHTYKSR